QESKVSHVAGCPATHKADGNRRLVRSDGGSGLTAMTFRVFARVLYLDPCCSSTRRCVQSATAALLFSLYQLHTMPRTQATGTRMSTISSLTPLYSTVLLRRSSRITSRQLPCSLPILSRRPTSRKPRLLWSAMLLSFSGKIPAWSVQIPHCSACLINSVSSTRPRP